MIFRRKTDPTLLEMSEKYLQDAGGITLDWWRRRLRLAGPEHREFLSNLAESWFT